MKPHWKGGWIALAAFLVLIPNTGALLLPPDVTLIPSQISMNSSFIMLADPHASASEISGINWIIYGLPTGYGEFTYTGGNWIKFVADKNLFPFPSYDIPYTLEVTAIPHTGQTQNSTWNISVGGIAISSNIVVTGNNVYVSAYTYPEQVESGISYKIYSYSLDEVPGKSGAMIYYPPIHGYTADLTLPNGEYYITFTANSSTDFGGSAAKVIVGGGSSGYQDVQADSIIYNPVITPGQEFRIETFKITNIGMQNLTALSISVPTQISSYLSITPKKSFLEPNESSYLTVTIKNVQSSANISTFATLLSGSTELKQIPVELRISVIGGINPASCTGMPDMSECLGGICCGGICRKSGAECCISYDCPTGETCSNYKCVESSTPGECQGRSDMATCTGGICCDEICIAGGECCSSYDCPSSGQTCTYRNKCESGGSTNECDGKSDGAVCTGGYCCDGLCQECCTNSDCDMSAGETCSYGMCTASSTGEGVDIATIALIGGGVAAAGVAGFFLYKKFLKKKKKDEGDEDFEGGESEEDEFSDDDFY
jgi:hypothetical protein